MDTDFLFAQPSFSTGVGRTFDLFGLFDLYNISPTPEEADRRAIYSDFAMVGQDLIAAMNEFAAENSQDQPPPLQYSFGFPRDEAGKRLGA